MPKEKKSTINVQDTAITILSQKNEDFICLTDMAKAKEGEARAADIIKNWIRSRTTLEFIGTWEQMNNSNFKVVEFDHFKMQTGLPSFVLSPGQWVEKQLLVLANLESMNAEFIRMGLSQAMRLEKLNGIAIQQLISLTANPNIKKLTDGK